MANPYFTSSQHFGRSKPTMPGGYPMGEAGYAQQQVGTPAYDPQFAQVQEAYYAPSATPAQTGRMTYDDVIMKSTLVLGTIVAAAALAWFAVPAEMVMPVMWIGLLGGFALGLVNSFKREPAPGLIMAYAVFEGAFLGIISKVFELQFQGIVMQAVLATFVTFGVTFALYKTKMVRVTGKFMRGVMIALIAYTVFCLVNLGIMVFAPGAFGPWGLRSGGLGLVIGAAAVVLAAICLILDFNEIERGVTNGQDRKYAWSAAFGLALTLVWLYLEFLRLLAILRN